MRLHRRFLLTLGSASFLIPMLSTAHAQPEVAAVVAEGNLHVASPSSRITIRKTPIVAAVERVKGAVVNILSERTITAVADVHGGAPSLSHVNGMGTGIIIDPRGYIVTNTHVIDDVNVLRVHLLDGNTRVATIVSRNPEMDLALLKIDAPQPLPVIPIGTSSDLMVGETVIAIGNAFGYEHTVSQGIVSAIKRDVSLNKDMSYKALIQTDASINPGNSGGPLVNVLGELVGVNVAIRAGAQGIGFAIPADQMIRTVNDMLRTRRRTQTYDGIGYRDRLEQSDDGPRRSVVVERTDADSPAQKAGIRPGDLLVQVGDTNIVCSYDVERGFLDRRAGEPVSILVRRQAQEQRLELVLAAADRSQHPPVAVDLVRAKLGLQLTPIANDSVSRINGQLHGGMEVSTIDADGPASKAGIRKGDILVGLHQWETLTMDNVNYVLSHPDLATFTPLSFFIVRNGQVRRGTIAQTN